MRSSQAHTGILVALSLVFAAASPAAAQDYPHKPIRIIVGAGAGGPSDIPARLAAQILQAKFGQPVVVENRAGAAGTVAARFVAGSAPDGYTLLVGNTTVLATQPSVSASAGFDPTSFAAVAKVSQSHPIAVANVSAPWTTVQEFLSHARANPGKLNYGHTGPGGLPNLAGELLKLRAGLDIVGVPFRSGSETVTAVMNQAIDLTFENITILVPLIKEGKIRPLVVASDVRTPLLPDLPTTKEAGIADFEVASFNGIVAPAKTPDPIIRKLNEALNEGLQTPQMKETIARLGVVFSPETPEEFSRFIMAQFLKWQAVAKAANIRID